MFHTAYNQGPAPGFPHFPELNLREPIEWAQREASSDRYSWPMLILAAVALAVVAEASMILKVQFACNCCPLLNLAAVGMRPRRRRPPRFHVELP